MSIETNRVNSEQEAQRFLNSNWETEIAEEGQFSENAPETLISVIKKWKKKIFEYWTQKNNNLMNENKNCTRENRNFELDCRRME